MKKARLVLGAVAAFTVIGGAFAFKAARSTDKIFVRAANTTICTVQLNGLTLTPTTTTLPILSTTFATDIAGECTTTTHYYRGL